MSNKPVTCACSGKIRKLNIIGYISGWLGIVWRTVAAALLSTLIYNITEYDPSIYSIITISCLTYVLVSILINMTFLYGVFIERRHFMLPYMGIVTMEMIVGVIGASGTVMVLFIINSFAFAIYVLLAALILTGVHFIFWLYNILLYKDMYHKTLIRSNGGKM